MLQSEPAGPAAGTKLLLLAAQCDSSLGIGSRRSGSGKEIHVYSTHAATAEFNIAGARPAEVLRLFAIPEFCKNGSSGDASGTLGENALHGAFLCGAYVSQVTGRDCVTVAGLVPPRPGTEA